ncbi:hypothetical protein TRFO_25156 [Tritrichomonas foetus]|uniref:Uncharacterized protein n=1 Tax=Tritrichomonas foetus TaxID=1144522 RepID=A0A1J4K699_9EUKA|nr:hypothetical protein TRFO_25156 [Tritrichomonas foetus]|eukprot:OHT06699.1 hypothetical protein TRFO_25156 [Tritrichomonas foetus]
MVCIHLENDIFFSFSKRLAFVNSIIEVPISGSFAFDKHRETFSIYSKSSIFSFEHRLMNDPLSMANDGSTPMKHPRITVQSILDINPRTLTIEPEFLEPATKEALSNLHISPYDLVPFDIKEDFNSLQDPTAKINISLEMEKQRLEKIQLVINERNRLASIHEYISKSDAQKKNQNNIANKDNPLNANQNDIKNDPTENNFNKSQLPIDLSQNINNQVSPPPLTNRRNPRAAYNDQRKMEAVRLSQNKKQANEIVSINKINKQNNNLNKLNNLQNINNYDDIDNDDVNSLNNDYDDEFYTNDYQNEQNQNNGNNYDDEGNNVNEDPKKMYQNLEVIQPNMQMRQEMDENFLRQQNNYKNIREQKWQKYLHEQEIRMKKIYKKPGSINQVKELRNKMMKDRQRNEFTTSSPRFSYPSQQPPKPLIQNNKPQQSSLSLPSNASPTRDLNGIVPSTIVIPRVSHPKESRIKKPLNGRMKIPKEVNY